MLLKKLVFIILLGASGLSSAWVDVKTDQTVWAFGDSHGAYQELVKTLTAAELIDADLNWQGGQSILVSTGDILDRGPHPRKILDLLMKIEKQAEAAGGSFYMNLGNHEVMILVGDYRYVAAEEYQEFAEEESEELRASYFQHYLTYHEHDKKLQVQADKDTQLAEIRSAFEQTYPAGFFARFEAFSVDGKYGQWLLDKPFISKINQSLFMHGGLSPELPYHSINDLNLDLKEKLKSYIYYWHQLVKRGQLLANSKLAQREKFIRGLSRKSIKKFSGFLPEFLFSSQSPTWYRGASYCHPYYETQLLSSNLERFGADKLFVGHTRTISHQIETQHRQQVYFLDTGMLGKVYNGKGNIAKIKSGQVTALDSSGKQYQPSSSLHNSISYPRQLTRDELVNILKTAPIAKKEALSTGITKPFRLTFKDTPVRVRALFKTIDTFPGIEKRRTKSSDEKYADRYKYDIAAYKLSEHMGFGLVPISVEREVDGTKGVVQFWIDDSHTKLTADEEGIEYSGHCNYAEQRNLLRIFDMLIFNQDRNLSNILFEPKRGQMLWIDHSRSFSAHRRLPKYIKKRNIRIYPQVRQQLEALDTETLNQVMMGLLNKDQIRAILRRRSLILDLDRE